MNKQSILECHNLQKSYIQGENILKILIDIELIVNPGETISIVGGSGSGKSTLLHLLGGLDRANKGEILIDGSLINELSDDQICRIRNKNLGFIYQFHHLLPEFTALENVLMPLMITGVISKEKNKRATDILHRLGLIKRLHHYPSQLSGGERQRVAIARAVINNPKLILADEPTGNLDNHTAAKVLEIFFSLQAELKTSLVIVTHDNTVAKMTSTHYQLHNGHLARK